jgi:hypothetical protein
MNNTLKFLHPACAYAHVYDRKHEAYDGINFKSEHASQGCKDIADQLINENSYINVDQLIKII